MTRGNSAWRTIGCQRIFARSTYEANYARYLQYLQEMGHIISWQHEPKTFWFDGIRRGCVSYKPDFRVQRSKDHHDWVEVKGYMDAKSATKIKRFRKYFPDEKLLVIDGKWFTRNNSKMRLLIPEWEKGRSPRKKILLLRS